jgi:hypothetical protein
LQLARQFFEQGEFAQGLRYCARSVASHASPAVIGRAAVLLCKKTLRRLAPRKARPQRVPVSHQTIPQHLLAPQAAVPQHLPAAPLGQTRAE